MPQRPRRIAVDLTPLLPGGANGGAKPLTLELLRNLALAAPETQFVLLTSRACHAELASLDSANVSRFLIQDSIAPGLWGLLRNLAKRALPWLSPKFEADLLFCPFTAPFYHDPHRPTVCLVHDLQFKYYPEFFTPAQREERSRNFSEACQKAARIICVSEHVRHTVLAGSDAEPHQVVTVHTTLSRRLPRPEKTACETVLAGLGLSRAKYFFYPANFWAHKNHVALLKAFAIFLGQNPDCGFKLALTGAPGPGQEKIRRLSCELGIESSLCFAGFVEEIQLACLMANCLALVFPSLFEGFGMPLLECLALGRPVACSKATSLPEVAGNAALYFDPVRPEDISQALTRLAREPGLVEELVEKGRKRLADFGDARDMALKYLEVFEQAVSAD